jgi:hypothetical protein
MSKMGQKRIYERIYPPRGQTERQLTTTRAVFAGGPGIGHTAVTKIACTTAVEHLEAPGRP